MATRVVAADATTLQALVSDPANQARLFDGVSSLLRPRAHVDPRVFARLVKIRVQLGHRDVLWLTWIFTAGRGTTEVDLAAQLEADGVLARLGLLLGGRRWLEHRLDTILDSLATLTHRAAENFDDATYPIVESAIRIGSSTR
ncbi:MAG TPA: hypothetical protein VNA28_05130 [Solirubrobacteraceae bacterium]|nr:hypothetical protein [Solirubrobacteraceae bacterium]